MQSAEPGESPQNSVSTKTSSKRKRSISPKSFSGNSKDDEEDMSDNEQKRSFRTTDSTQIAEPSNEETDSGFLLRPSGNGDPNHSTDHRRYTAPLTSAGQQQSSATKTKSRWEGKTVDQILKESFANEEFPRKRMNRTFKHDSSWRDYISTVGFLAVKSEQQAADKFDEELKRKAETLKILERT